MSNFNFLKKNNKNLFEIAFQAENLFKDEYFEQSMVQTRRFAENICKDLLASKVDISLQNETFDSLINLIKDNSFGNIRMQEFVDDLYFLKKHGNNSAHSSSSNQNGKLALECLERAFEISIFYSNEKYGYDKKLDKEVFSEELLMTGKKSISKPLKAKYTKALKKERSSSAKTTKTSSKTQKTKGKKKPKTKKKQAGTKKKSLFLTTLIVLSAISILTTIAIYVFIKFY